MFKACLWVRSHCPCQLCSQNWLLSNQLSYLAWECLKRWVNLQLIVGKSNCWAMCRAAQPFCTWEVDLYGCEAGARGGYNCCLSCWGFIHKGNIDGAPLGWCGEYSHICIVQQAYKVSNYLWLHHTWALKVSSSWIMYGFIIHLRLKISFVAMVGFPIRRLLPSLTLFKGVILNIFHHIHQTITLFSRPFWSSSLIFVALGLPFILNTCCTMKCTRLASLSHPRRHTVGNKTLTMFCTFRKTYPLLMKEIS